MITVNAPNLVQLGEKIIVNFNHVVEIKIDEKSAILYGLNGTKFTIEHLSANSIEYESLKRYLFDQATTRYYSDTLKNRGIVKPVHLIESEHEGIDSSKRNFE